MLVPGDALIPAAPDPKPEKPAAQSLISNINDKLGALARDFKSPVVPDNADIVTTLGIAAMPSLDDLLPTAESEDPDAELEPAEAPESEFSEPEAPDLVASEPKSFEPKITPSAVVEEPARESAAASSREFVRVESGALEEMLNSAGEISIFHSRLNQQLGSIQFNLEELGSTVTRLREQLRAMDIETEAQILNRYKQEADNEQFDPLEMDRFSTIQQLSRALAESSSDVSSIKDLLQNLSRETELLLGQEARTVAELQDNLMRTRMVPFQQHVPRFSRLVRQTANEERKKVNFIVEGSNGELDRQVLEKMLPPFEHMLRNAVVHGIEPPEERRRLNKDETGIVKIRLRREGSEVLIEVSDDGAGLNVDEIRNQASRKIDLSDTQVVSDEAAMRLILKAGVTTAKQLTQYAGRGVGMDVVVNEVAKLGGTLGIKSEAGEGCTFIIRLPYTLAVAQALIVHVANETYALPMPSIEGVIRVSHDEFDGYLEKTVPVIEYGGVVYTFRHLGQYLGLTDLGMPLDTESVSLILVKTEDEAVALITDKAVDSREIVVKALGAQLATVRGVSGATILGDGRIVIILDVTVLVRSMPMSEDSTPLVGDITSHRAPLAMVVDDSITMRRVSQRLLERRGLRVVTANDGVDALEKMEDEIPDIVLLDIEMPRMDGYEFAKNLRNNPDTRKVPIIMITSRSGEKHRARAIELGVNDYLGKPYQEQEMLESVRILLADKAPATL
jgi:chemosensory pili system protein ChpA (sensor histidine kinase/response regulator)